MKSKIFTILFALTAIIQFVACTNEEGIIDNPTTDLRISTSIESRAVITSTIFSTGDEIGVFLPEQTKRENVKAIYGNNWELSQRIPLTASEEPVYAYYPYIADCSGLNVPVSIDGVTDYLYGKSQSDVSMINPEAHLVFKHALARITFSIKLSADNASTKVLSEIILRNVGEITAIANFGWMDITTGEINERSIGNILYKLEEGEIRPNNILDIEMLVIPTTIETDNQVEAVFFIDGKQYVISIPATTWEAGQQYTYPITLNISDNESEEIDPSVPAKVGDYFYSDGTWSSDYKASKTCIGIVFALSKEQDGDIDVSLEESMHGRIVALQDLDKKYAWANEEGDVEGLPFYSYPAGFIVSNNNSYILTWLPIDGQSTYAPGANYTIPYNYDTWPTEKSKDFALAEYSGKNNTSYITAFEFPAGNACYNKTMEEIENGFWYLPSCGEMGRLAMAWAIGKVQKSRQTIFTDLIDIEGESYWTSTERSNSTAFSYEPNRGYVSVLDSKTEKLNVRPIASF